MIAGRLRWIILSLSAVALLVAATVVIMQLTQRPKTYIPGEEHAEITTKLARGIPNDAPTPLFKNVTEEVGLSGFRSFAGVRTSQLPEDMGGGAAWGDYDNDGDDDLFLVSNGGPLSATRLELAPSLLFENLGGRFAQVEEFPDTRIIGMGAAWGDYNGDERLDLVVSGYNSLILYSNSAGTFVRDDTFPEPLGYWAGVSWIDVDNDGDLDLYVCGYVQYREADKGPESASLQYGQMVPYNLNPSSYDPQKNLLYLNEGNGSFTEAAEILGISNPEGRSLNALWHDFNGDGRPDLYVANDISDNVFFLNRRAGFEDISHSSWVADYRGAMGLAVGDWDADGDDDLFVTHWIAQENALYDSVLDTSENLADPPRFMDIADRVGLGQIALQYIGWGTQFADFDGDGWLDLVVANGSTFEIEERRERLEPQKPFLFWNRLGEGYYNIAPLSEVLDQYHVGRGVALSDYDDDGDMDILMVHHGEGVQLLRNDMQTGNWIKLRLRGPGFGYGAVVVCRIGEAEFRRATSSPSYLSQSSMTIHIGLGTSESVDDMEVHWSGGKTDRYGSLQANSTWELRKGDSIPRRVVGSAPAPRSTSANAPTSDEEKERIATFWEKQRAAMKAMKIERDLPKAVELFKAALALDPEHEDSLYYLGSCLYALGESERALETFGKLTSVNPKSHRGYKQWGVVRGLTAATLPELAMAEAALERAMEINPEETGALFILGEIDLLQREYDSAEKRLAWVTRTNPRSASGFFLRSFIAWNLGNGTRAGELLIKAREALGGERTPSGTTSEGDVQRQMHTDESLLSRFWDNWDGSAEHDVFFPPLKTYVEGYAGGSES